MAQKFDSSIRDSQGTHVEPINVENFDLDEYAEYEESLLERNRKFFEEDKSGLLVYRRVRADGVFYDKWQRFQRISGIAAWSIKGKYAV